MQFPVYQAEISADLASDLEVSFIAFVENPAIEKNFQAFNNHHKEVKFVLDEEKRIVSGPAMIAGLYMYRNDPELGEYYVYFTKETIQTIVEKFSAKGLMKNFNVFHDPKQKTDGVVIFNSFIIDRSLGINPPKNFDDLPDGSWWVSAKVSDPAIWAKVKSGDIKGFSVEGIFEYMPSATLKMSKEQTFVKLGIELGIFPKDCLNETN